MDELSSLSQDLRRQAGKRAVNAVADSRAMERTVCLNFNGPLDLTIEDPNRCESNANLSSPSSNASEAIAARPTCSAVAGCMRWTRVSGGLPW